MKNEMMKNLVVNTEMLKERELARMTAVQKREKELLEREVKEALDKAISFASFKCFPKDMLDELVARYVAPNKKFILDELNDILNAHTDIIKEVYASPFYMTAKQAGIIEEKEELLTLLGEKFEKSSKILTKKEAIAVVGELMNRTEGYPTVEQVKRILYIIEQDLAFEEEAKEALASKSYNVCWDFIHNQGSKFRDLEVLLGKYYKQLNTYMRILGKTKKQFVLECISVDEGEFRQDNYNDIINKALREKSEDKYSRSNDDYEHEYGRDPKYCPEVPTPIQKIYRHLNMDVREDVTEDIEELKELCKMAKETGTQGFYDAWRALKFLGVDIEEMALIMETSMRKAKYYLSKVEDWDANKRNYYIVK